MEKPEGTTLGEGRVLSLNAGNHLAGTSRACLRWCGRGLVRRQRRASEGDQAGRMSVAGLDLFIGFGGHVRAERGMS
jgi:hypothetical protein